MAAANPRTRGSEGGDAVSDTPRTDRDDRPYPSLEHAQHIRFEGNDCVVMHPEEYEALYEQSRQLERELAAVTADLKFRRELGALQQQEYDKVTAERDVLRADLCTFAVDMEKQLTAVTAERDTARATCQELVTDSTAATLAETVVRVTAERDVLKAANDAVADAVHYELRSVTAERDVLKADLCAFAVDMEKQLTAVTAERDALDSQISHASQAYLNLGKDYQEYKKLEADLSTSQQEARRLREALETTHKCMQLFSSFLDHWSIRTNKETSEVYKAWDDARKTAGTNEQRIVAALASTPAPVHADTERLSLLKSCELNICHLYSFIQHNCPTGNSVIAETEALLPTLRKAIDAELARVKRS